MPKLTWKVDKANRIAYSEPPGYQVTWTVKTEEKAHLFLAFFVEGTHRTKLGHSGDREFVKHLCEVHFDTRPKTESPTQPQSKTA